MLDSGASSSLAGCVCYPIGAIDWIHPKLPLLYEIILFIDLLLTDWLYISIYLFILTSPIIYIVLLCPCFNFCNFSLVCHVHVLGNPLPSFNCISCWYWLYTPQAPVETSFVVVYFVWSGSSSIWKVDHVSLNCLMCRSDSSRYNVVLNIPSIWNTVIPKATIR